MSASALALVLLGALCHALWNIAIKKAAGGLAFVWLFGVVSVGAATPLALWVSQAHAQHFNVLMWSAAIASGVIHIVYSLALQKGYRVSDFAVVYPTARGTGPTLTVVAALVLLGEKPGALGLAGVASVLLGVFLSAGAWDMLRARPADSQHTQRRHRGVLWGVLTGLCIACYTVIDGWAIKSLGMHPVLFYVVALWVRTLGVAPFALRQMPELRRQWHINRRYILIVGLLSPAAYTLILFAMQTAPLAYVAPVREVSMLIGTFLGAKLLQEAVKPSQWAAACMMLVGVAVLAMA
jgi:drug/metabolite transporter (DMT)-like permease